MNRFAHVLKWLLFAPLFLAVGCGAPEEAEQLGDDPLADSDARAIVLVFVRTDCPIANAYSPRLREISDEFSPEGVRFWMVYPEPGDDGESIGRHLSEYSLPDTFVRDADHRLVKLAGAIVTPEVAVFIPRKGDPDLVYAGRIDDRYVDWGKRRESASVHDLRDVLTAALNGEKVSFRRTGAIGCTIGEIVP